jgi:hypothetical protein
MGDLQWPHILRLIFAKPPVRWQEFWQVEKHGEWSKTPGPGGFGAVQTSGPGGTTHDPFVLD